MPQIVPIKRSSIRGQRRWSGDRKPLISVLANVLPRVQDDLIAC